MTREIWVLINICTALTVFALAFGLIFPKNKISSSNQSNSVNYNEKVDITDEKQNLKTDTGSSSEELDEFEVDDEIGSIVDKLNEPPDDLYARHLKLYLAKALGIKPNKRFPNGFLSDAYISGFSTGYFAVVQDIVLNGINWPKERKGSQAIQFFTTLGPRDDNLALKLLEDKSVAAKLTLNETFVEGRDHGNLLAATYYEKLRHDLSEPLIDACRNLANNTSLSMPDAVFALTLQKYVVSKWPIETSNETNKKNELKDQQLKSALKDFAARMQTVDNDSLFVLLLEVIRELNQLFEISPDAKSWFSVLDSKHVEDLQNLHAATALKISVMQSDGDFAAAAHHFVILMIITGILDDEMTFHAFEMWMTIKEGADEGLRKLRQEERQLLRSGHRLEATDVQKFKLAQEALIWDPDALEEKLHDI